MNKATATLTILDNKRGVVDIEYTFVNRPGHKSHTGFSTVEFVPGKISKYEQGYNRAEALAKDQGCRLERYSMKGNPTKMAMFKVFFTNLNYFADEPFPSFDEAVTYVRDKNLEAVIYTNGKSAATYHPQSGLKVTN